MSENPYINDDADDDLFGSPHSGGDRNVFFSGERHILDGSLCHCGETHSLSLPPNIPPEVVEQLSEVLESLPDAAVNILVSSDKNVSNKLYHDFLQYGDSLDKVGRNAPILVAMAKAIVQLAGKDILAPLIKLAEIEDYIIKTHAMIDAVTHIRLKIENTDKTFEPNEMSDFLNTLTKIGEAADNRLGKLVLKYRIVTEELGENIDEDLIKTGKYSSNNSYYSSRILEQRILNELIIDNI